MDALPDLPTITRDVARWEAEFALDPAANAAQLSSTLNLLAVRQVTSDMPDAAVASWIKAAEVAGYAAAKDPKDAAELESCALFNLIPALLDNDQPERALHFAERLAKIDAGEFGESGGRGLAAEFKARCLRRLGRTEEELGALTEALGYFALVGETPHVPDFAEHSTTQVSRRIAEIIEEQGESA